MQLTKIRVARFKRGLFQWELAKKAGLPESILSRIETGRLQPSLDQLCKIAEVLSVDPEELRGEV